MPQPPTTAHPTPTTPLRTHKRAHKHLPCQQAPPRVCELDDRPQLTPTIPQPGRDTWRASGARGGQAGRVEGWQGAWRAGRARGKRRGRGEGQQEYKPICILTDPMAHRFRALHLILMHVIAGEALGSIPAADEKSKS
ncbi:hypothetical protein H0H92_007769, partial [Tricholoma furcatifolium]